MSFDHGWGESGTRSQYAEDVSKMNDSSYSEQHSQHPSTVEFMENQIHTVGESHETTDFFGNQHSGLPVKTEWDRHTPLENSFNSLNESTLNGRYQNLSTDPSPQVHSCNQDGVFTVPATYDSAGSDECKNSGGNEIQGLASSGNMVVRRSGNDADAPLPATSINTPRNHIYSQHQSYTQPPSQLRQQIYPELQSGVFAPTMTGQKTLGTSPRHYQRSLYTGPTIPQSVQPFQESNLRTHSHQSFDYSPNHFTYADPQRHLHRNYSNPEIYSSRSTPYTNMGSRRSQVPSPITTPSTHESHVRNSHAISSADESHSVGGVKRGVTPAASAEPKRQLRKNSRRMANNLRNVNDKSSVVLTKPDQHYLEELVDAMTNGSDAEDNQGMINTWDKIRDSKGDKIREKAGEMFTLLKTAQHTQLVDKKPINQYPNFDHRFKETIVALRTQKTVCKHLMEAPYSHIVANDPTYAAQRVRNNRRVNGQKREAITRGRQAMGIQGQGKGNRIKKILRKARDDSQDYTSEDVEGEEDFEDDGQLGEDDFPNTPLTPEAPVRRSTRGKRQSIPLDDEDYVDNSQSSKRVKRESERPRRSRSHYDVQEKYHIVDSAGPSDPVEETSFDHDLNANYMPLQPIEVAHDRQRYNYNPILDYQYYHANTQSLPPMMAAYPQNLFHHGHSFGGFPQQLHGDYSSGTEHESFDRPVTSQTLPEFDFPFDPKESFGSS